MSIPLNPAQQVGNLHADMGGSVEASRVTCVADEGALEVQDITCPATAGATQGDFFIISNVAGDTVAVWLDIDADGTAPNGTAFQAADDAVEVNIATGNTAAQVAAAVILALGETLADATISSGGTGVVRVTQDLMGNTDAATTSNAAENGAGSFSAATVTAGADSQYQDTFFPFRDGENAAHYAWFNVNGEGTDPSESGAGVEVAIAAGASAAVVGAAVAAAIDSVSGFDADHEGNGVVKIATEAEASVTDIGAGDAPVTVSVSSQGVAERMNPGMSPASISNNPSAF